MSRLSKKPIPIPPSVEVRVADGLITAKGPKGEIVLRCLPFTEAEKASDGVTVRSTSRTKQARMNEGTMWANTKNAVHGVAAGFQKSLEINGVGYRAVLEDKTLVLSLGFSNPIRFVPPAGIAIAVEKNIIVISGIEKQLVGQVAAKIRSFRKPEPYKGKGIRYSDEVIRRKAGKKAAATA